MYYVFLLVFSLGLYVSGTLCKWKPASLTASSRDLPWQPASVISSAPVEVQLQSDSTEFTDTLKRLCSAANIKL